MEVRSSLKEDIRHPETFGGKVNAIHKCLQAYLNMFSNMPPSWYISNARDSCMRKGFQVSLKEMSRYFVLYNSQWKGRAVIQDGEEYIIL